LGNAKIGRVQENSRGTPGDARLLATAGSAYLPFPKLLRVRHAQYNFLALLLSGGEVVQPLLRPILPSV
jgi:hypothetical protein